MVNAFEQVAVEQNVTSEEEVDEKMVVVDEKAALSVETYNLDNKMLHNGLAQNEIVVAAAVVVVEELIHG